MGGIVKTGKGSLSDFDWKVVKVARRDGPRSLDPDSFLSRFARIFFGLPVPAPLANERLEALRRFCVRAWHWDLVRSNDLRALIGAGYSTADARRILAYVANRRGFAPALRESAI